MQTAWKDVKKDVAPARGLVVGLAGGESGGQLNCRGDSTQLSGAGPSARRAAPGQPVPVQSLQCTEYG